MFTVKDKLTFTHDVTVLTPVDGGHAEEKLKTTFNFLPADEVAAFDLTSSEGTTDFLKAIVAELHELVNESGSVIAYSEAVRDRLLSRSDIRKALGNHYLAAVANAPAGN
jgi:hypothetical protein